ncbi:MAG: hypothetical protein CMK65_07295 [Pseudoalteromonas sp.]|uniref:hypothetical protein n=1 Tax=Pseudoalteromonas sp. TaxID=53249 RepID=UPI000C8ECC5C|nr:hypothetical protein [Pseudoalteromonas sp.]MAD03408.1 hypothetical protein [Pseudoalteromonas sp.]|tara:strand:- start:13777 stop:14307 length:531 start_codon:yes stop_codon:yes gene_type:complete
MEKFELDKTVIQILSMPNVNHFTATEIRTAYIAIKQDVELNPTVSRRFVYEELLKLTRRGWLIRSTTKKKGITHYAKSDLFDHAVLKEMVSAMPNEEADERTPVSYSQMLIQRLNQYNSALLEGLGAVKEYVALNEIYPDQHDDLKGRYMAVQENNHILKGKISVLNELIKSTKEN